MEPLSATVAAIVTGFLAKGAATLTQQVGEAAANAARTIAEAVLDRLKADPAEERTVERYEKDPEAQQPAIEAAIGDAVAADPAFAARLEALVATYREAAGNVSTISVGGSVGGSIVQGDHNTVVSGGSGIAIGASGDASADVDHGSPPPRPSSVPEEPT